LILLHNIPEIKTSSFLAWRHRPIIPALWRLRKEDHEFEVSLGYIASSRSAWAT
jgi:uncharacterized phage-associated protein